MGNRLQRIYGGACHIARPSGKSPIKEAFIPLRCHTFNRARQFGAAKPERANAVCEEKPLCLIPSIFPHGTRCRG